MIYERDEKAGLALALEGITKRFGRTLALDDVSLSIRPGTVHALLGENGAGKTTLMRAAFGLIPVDAGTVTIAGAKRTVRTAADAIAAGVGMVHQHFTNVAAMSVFENVALGGRGRLDAHAARRRVLDIGARTGLTLDPDARAGNLSVGGQQRLEIVKALARDARLLILDEPTAVLAPAEADELLRWLKHFADDGNAVVLITHKLAEAIAIANDVTVLRQGRVVLKERIAGVTTTSLATAMLGAEPSVGQAHRELSTDQPTIAPTGIIEGGGAVVASVSEIEIVDDRGAVVVRDATLDLRAGEIVGIAAVEGAGQRELLRVLAGRTTAACGTVVLPHTIGFVPEDRHRDALVLEFSTAENVALDGAGAARGRIPWRRIRERAERLIRDFDVRGAAADKSVRTLSGGNQQKLILARELDKAPQLLVVENPTRGLDIRAAQDVRDRLRAAAAGGTAVVIYSSDLDEVLSVATRTVVMHAGRLLDVAGDRDAVGRAMLGVE